MFDFSTIDEVKLAKGNHISAAEGLCFMEMVAWFAGEAHGDKPACACPVLGRYGIVINDAMPDDARDRLLKPLVSLIAGTFDPASEQKRAEFLAMWAVNKIVPIALRAGGFDKDADACERAGTLADARAATATASASANTADAAAAAVYANSAVYAAASANAAAAASANTAAAAAARAYAAAAYAAAASANTAAAAAARAYATAAAAEVWPVAVEGLRQAILIGRHEGFTAVDLVARREKLAELCQ